MRNDNLEIPDFHPIPVKKQRLEAPERTWKTVTLDALEKALPWMLALTTVFALFMAAYTY